MTIKINNEMKLYHGDYHDTEWGNAMWSGEKKQYYKIIKHWDYEQGKLIYTPLDYIHHL